MFRQPLNVMAGLDPMSANITAARCANLGPPSFQRHGLGEPFHLSPRDVRAARDHRVEPGDDDQWSQTWAFALAGTYVGAYGVESGHDIDERNFISHPPRRESE